MRKLREAVGCSGGPAGAGGGEAAGGFEQKLHRWRARHGGWKAADAKRLQELERENTKLKEIVAEQLLENQALKEIAKGNW